MEKKPNIIGELSKGGSGFEIPKTAIVDKGKDREKIKFNESASDIHPSQKRDAL